MPSASTVLPFPGAPYRNSDLPEFTAGPSWSSIPLLTIRLSKPVESVRRSTNGRAAMHARTYALYCARGTGAGPT
jgi:hypothetical protein